MSLRLRLLTGLAALVVLGLGVFGTVTYLSVNHFLLNRLDSQLSDAARALTGTDAARLRIPGGGGAGGGPGPDGPDGTGSDETSARNAAGPELFVEFVHPDGSAFEPVKATRDPGGVAPQLAPVVAAMATGHGGDRPQARTFTTSAAAGVGGPGCPEFRATCSKSWRAVSLGSSPRIGMGFLRYSASTGWL